jgi:hypothetical protein
MASIIKLMRKLKEIICTWECQEAWEIIKGKYVEVPILIALNWHIEFHVHIDVFNLVIKVMLAQNLDTRYD